MSPELLTNLGGTCFTDLLECGENAFASAPVDATGKSNKCVPEPHARWHRRPKISSVLATSAQCRRASPGQPCDSDLKADSLARASTIEHTRAGQRLCPAAARGYVICGQAFQSAILGGGQPAIQAAARQPAGAEGRAASRCFPLPSHSM